MQFTIPGHFNGPHTSGNGGYSAGSLAAFIDGAARIRLNVPPPLDRPLQVADQGDQLVARDGDVVVMQGTSAAGESVPATPFVPFAEAAAARDGFPGWDYHGADACFVCGPAREDDYGLRIFPGPVGEHLVAAPWVPTAAIAGSDGVVPDEIVWAVIDCPGAWAANAYDPVGMPYFPTLGTMAAELVQPVTVGERYVVVGRHRTTEGRKVATDVALYTEVGELVARSDHIEIKLFDYDTKR